MPYAALRAGILCGFAGMAVDVDHIPYYFFHANIPVLFNTFDFGTGRFLHPALFYLACGVIACTGGLLVLDILMAYTIKAINGIARAIDKIGVAEK
jgi:hypothetical protein